MEKNSKSDIVRVLFRYFIGESTESDRGYLDRWRSRNLENKKVFERLKKQDQLRDDLFQMKISEIKVQQTLKRVLEADTNIQVNNPSTIVRKLKRYLPYAAAILIAFVGGYSYYLNNLSQPKTTEIVKAEDILGGDNSAFLRLSSGKKLVLKNHAEGLVTGEGGVQYTDGTFVLTNDLGNIEDEYELNTPKGSTYQIKLSDGTKVWLNADSKLSYPNYFTKEERIVHLDGEAYFEVSKNHKPFIVKTARQEIKVLGTTFNVNAYSEDLISSTTLLEGSVKITDPNTQETRTLIPGQQGLSKANHITVVEPNVNDIIAWKSGKISFDNKSFKQVMSEISRWYDLKIVYQGDIPNVTFFGDAYRSNNLSIVLKALQSAEIAYEMKENRTLIITEKKEE